MCIRDSDTTAPEIEISQNELFIARGSFFNLEQYVTVEDLSGTCTIEYSGDFDPDKDGVYNISVYASDALSLIHILEKLFADNREEFLRFYESEKGKRA